MDGDIANVGPSMGKARFNAVERFPQHPDEMGLWSRGGSTRLRVVEDFGRGGSKWKNGKEK